MFLSIHPLKPAGYRLTRIPTAPIRLSETGEEPIALEQRIDGIEEPWSSFEGILTPVAHSAYSERSAAMCDTEMSAESIHQQNGLRPSVGVRKAESALVGQLGKLRPIGNRPNERRQTTGAQLTKLPHKQQTSGIQLPACRT